MRLITSRLKKLERSLSPKPNRKVITIYENDDLAFARQQAEYQAQFPGLALTFVQIVYQN